MVEVKTETMAEATLVLVVEVTTMIIECLRLASPALHHLVQAEINDPLRRAPFSVICCLTLATSLATAEELATATAATAVMIATETTTTTTIASKMENKNVQK